MAHESRRAQPGWGNSRKPRPEGSGSGGAGGSGAHGVRLQRVLADAGVASRRDCEALIEAGRVRVNGAEVRVLPVFVDPENDTIEVDGRPIGKPERKLYLLLNKPERVLTTVDDASEFAGTGTARMTVLDLVDHPARARLFPVGRLDFATRGLVLLTNDGELANKLTHPRYGVPKVYEAVVRGHVSDEQLAELRKLVSKQERQDARKRTPESEPGPRLVGAGGRSRAEVELIASAPGETTIRLTLRERTGYPLRKLIVSAGCPVKKLTRVALGPLELTGVREGQWRELTRAELMLLRRDPRRAPAKPDMNDQKARGAGTRGTRTRSVRPTGPGAPTSRAGAGERSAPGGRTGPTERAGPGGRGGPGGRTGPNGRGEASERGGSREQNRPGGRGSRPGGAVSKGPRGPGLSRRGRPLGDGTDA